MNTEELKKLEATLWQTADTLRANSDLKSSEYSTPVLGLIFLLSHLMSGKIDVENLDIQFPASMRCAEQAEAQEETVHA